MITSVRLRTASTMEGSGKSFGESGWSSCCAAIMGENFAAWREGRGCLSGAIAMSLTRARLPDNSALALSVTDCSAKGRLCRTVELVRAGIEVCEYCSAGTASTDILPFVPDLIRSPPILAPDRMQHMLPLPSPQLVSVPSAFAACRPGPEARFIRC
jgi:hypothetical protein